MGKQAQQAYLIGNKALAKELSVKGQLHDMHMEAAHGKAQESIYHQRFVVPQCFDSSSSCEFRSEKRLHDTLI